MCSFLRKSEGPEGQPEKGVQSVQDAAGSEWALLASGRILASTLLPGSSQGSGQKTDSRGGNRRKETRSVAVTAQEDLGTAPVASAGRWADRE